MPSRLNPYLNFQGNAREAIEFYRSVFGGELQLTSYRDGGIPHDAADADKVMHGQLDAPNGMLLMAADAPSSGGSSAGGPASGPSIGISLSGDDDAELSGYFRKLSDGATIMEPLETAPWGDKFGMLTDRFGVWWMVNIAGAPAEQAGQDAVRIEAEQPSEQPV
ncbi:MAG: VOC family protein [Candidatus Limnocylindria bacterium]